MSDLTEIWCSPLIIPLSPPSVPQRGKGICLGARLKVECRAKSLGRQVDEGVPLRDGGSHGNQDYIGYGGDEVDRLESWGDDGVEGSFGGG
jgi:hypothetical protein